VIATPSLSATLKAKPIATAASAVVALSHGAELRPFASMLAKFGKEAARDVELLNRVLMTRSSRLTDAGIAQGWDAVTRLAKRMRSLPPGPGRTMVGYELEQSMQALFSHETDFVVLFTSDIAKQAVKLRAAKRAAAIKAVGTLIYAVPADGAQVLARLATDLDGGAPALKQLWKRFSALPGADAAALQAGELAAEFAPEMRRILRNRSGSLLQRQSQLWGYVSGVRGLLGEGYGLLSPVWLKHLATEMARVRRIANRLGPGHTVQYLTQMEHGLRLNGAEGPDAIIAIVNRAEKIIYDPMRAQVKVASISEAAIQHSNDLLRRVGRERQREFASAWYEFRPSPSGPLEAFIVRNQPDVAANLYLINAGGGRNPAADLADLRAMNQSVTELWFDVTVTQMTHLAISLSESAIKLLKTS
jgi:hypothetical protein